MSNEALTPIGAAWEALHPSGGKATRKASAMRRAVIGLAISVGLCAILAGLRADDTDKEKALRSQLIGTWRAASMKFNGQESDLPKTAVTYKHITPVGFVWLSHEKDTGKVFRVAGGTYTLHGDSYTEKVEYGMGGDFEVIKNSTPAFTCKVVGDKWYHTGKLANGTTIEEVWERVKSTEKGNAP